MRLVFPAVLVLAGLCHAAAAQPAVLDVNALPAQIKSLPWRAVSLSSVSPLERCRSLLLLNDALDELRAQLTTDADLLSAYVDAKGMGPEFASRPPLDDPNALTFAEAQQVAVALLRGPMTTSTYASALGEVPADQLAANVQLNFSGCQWKWEAMAHSRMLVRSMSAFLQAKGAMADYRAWVPGELERRAQEHEAELARRRAAAATQAQKQREMAQEQQQKLLQQEQQQQLAQQAAATAQMQQALCAAQQNQNSANNQGGTVVPSDGAYPDWYYGGLAGVGAAAWCRDGAYRGAAEARTDARVSGWHGGRRR